MIHSSLEGSASHACEGAEIMEAAAGAPAPRVVIGGSARARVATDKNMPNAKIKSTRANGNVPAHSIRRRGPIGGASCAVLDDPRRVI